MKAMSNEGETRSSTKPFSGKEILAAFTDSQDVCLKTETRPLDWVSKIGITQTVIGKFENQQRTGSFKFRGAYQRIKNRKGDKPIIAASAGNHGLAVAEAAKVLGIKATICIPTTASPLKKERLAAYGHSIVQQGASLEETIAYAQQLAIEFDWDFISPYNDSLLAMGQGGVAAEFLEQHPDITALVVPVGGGGLLMGTAILAKSINPSIKIIGVSPEKYPSFFLSIKNGRATQVPNYPTLADGLAVNLENGSITLQAGDDLIDELILVSEEEIAAASLALLFHESQLVEPSGAVGLAALISNKIQMESGGVVGLMFTGGNVSTGNLHKILNYPFTDETLFPYINMRGSKVNHQHVLKGVDFSSHLRHRISESGGSSDALSPQKIDREHDAQYWKGRYKHIRNLIDYLRKRLQEYLEYSELEHIRADQAAVTSLQRSISSIEETLGECVSRSIPNNASPATYNRHITECLQSYRRLLHELLSASLVLDWRSASYGQSWDTMFFHVDSQGNPGVNYNRYESNQVGLVEKALADILNLNLEEEAIFATSSGMAAYSLIESYLIRNVLKAGDLVYIPHYIYFETEEQISNLPHITIIRSETHNTKEIAQKILTEKPKVVFLDPLTNTVELRMTDIEAVLLNVSKEIDYDVYVIIDGTMLSGQLPVARLFSISRHIKIFYYDSCSKYLQLGLDIAMGGLAVVPVELQPYFDRLRRNTGTIMYDAAANIFPIYDRATHQARMSRFSRNARTVGELIEADAELKDLVFPHFPSLPSHEDYLLTQKCNSVGGIITFSFADSYLNQRDSLNSFIEMTLVIAKKHHVSLTKGVSFGFSIPRISAATAMAENSPPFLRLSVGDRSYEETILLAKALIVSFKNYIDNARKLAE